MSLFSAAKYKLKSHLKDKCIYYNLQEENGIDIMYWRWSQMIRLYGYMDRLRDPPEKSRGPPWGSGPPGWEPLAYTDGCLVCYNCQFYGTRFCCQQFDGLLVGFVSLRHRGMGSWFIRALIAVFYKHACHRPLTDLIPLVSLCHCFSYIHSAR